MPAATFRRHRRNLFRSVFQRREGKRKKILRKEEEKGKLHSGSGASYFSLSLLRAAGGRKKEGSSRRKEESDVEQRKRPRAISLHVIGQMWDEKKENNEVRKEGVKEGHGLQPFFHCSLFFFHYDRRYPTGGGGGKKGRDALTLKKGGGKETRGKRDVLIVSPRLSERGERKKGRYREKEEDPARRLHPQHIAGKKKETERRKETLRSALH